MYETVPKCKACFVLAILVQIHWPLYWLILLLYLTCSALSVLSPLLHYVLQTDSL